MGTVEGKERVGALRRGCGFKDDGRLDECVCEREGGCYVGCVG